MWYVARNGKKTAPMDQAKLIALAKAGKIMESDQVLRDGTDTWKDANTISFLMDIFNEKKNINLSNLIKNDGVQKAEELEVIDEPNAGSEDIPVLRLKSKNKSKKSELESKKSSLYFITLGIVGVFLASIVIGMYRGFTDQTQNNDQQKDVGQIQINPNVQKPIQADLKIVQVGIGQPVEVEPGHFIRFNLNDTSRNIFVYPRNLIGNEFARQNIACSHLGYTVFNNAGDGKIWKFKGFSEVGSIKDEFGNECSNINMDGKGENSKGMLPWDLTNGPRSVAPTEYFHSMLIYEPLPARTSKRFETYVIYENTKIIISDMRGKEIKMDQP